MKTRRFPLLAMVIAILLYGISEGRAEEGFPSRPRETSRVLPLPSRSSGVEPNATNRGKTISPSSNLWTTFISLGLIVGAIVLVGRGLKRYGIQGAQGLPIDALEVLGRRTIEPKVAVHLVRCGSRVLVLGVGSDGVRTLSEIDDPAEVERLTNACRNSSKEDVRSSRSTAPATTAQKMNSTLKAERVFMAVTAAGLWFASASSLDAQTNRVTQTIKRSQEVNQVRPAVAEERPNETPQAGIEQGIPLRIDPQKMGSPQQLGLGLKMLAFMTIFSLAPSILMMTTCFVRFTVALGLLRQALGTQQGPPNQVLTAICMFLTFLIMSPVWQKSYDEGIRPYTNPAAGESAIDEAMALARTLGPIRNFMSEQIDKSNNGDAVWMLLEFQRPVTGSSSASSWHEPQNYDDIPFTVLAPAYVLSELKVGFLIGFQLFLPFLVIDLVVAMILTSLGLTMMPPSMVSLPFKLLLFVLIDGWFLTVGMLLESIRMAS
jgi:flagellar biosynthesis protein FliP